MLGFLTLGLGAFGPAALAGFPTDAPPPGTPVGALDESRLDASKLPPEIADLARPQFSKQPVFVGPIGKLLDDAQAPSDFQTAKKNVDDVVAAFNAAPAAYTASSADDDQGHGAPVFAPHDFRAAPCDLNHDGLDDMVSNSFGNLYQRLVRTSLTATSGDNGRTLWTHENGVYMAANARPAGLALPEYLKPSNFDTADVDVDGDGVCDFLVLGTIDAVSLLPPIDNPVVVYAQIHYYVTMLSGATGRPIWTQNHNLDILRVFPRPKVCGDQFSRFTNIPTGLDHFLTSKGPRYVLELTNVTITRVNYGCPFNNSITNFLTDTNVTVFDSTTNRPLWNRIITYTSFVGPIINILRGESDLMGQGDHGPEKEILLDRFDWNTGLCTLKTLRGRDGGDFWETPYSAIQAQGGQFPNGEESSEILLWCLSYFLPDLTGDGIEDVVGSVFTAVFGESTTINGAVRTHWIPMDGTTARFFWRKDIRTQGWGYMRPVDARAGPRADPVESLVVGTIDAPHGNGFGGRFPKVQVHLNVLSRTDGLNRWFWEQDYALDTYLGWDYTLAQFWGNIAPDRIDFHPPETGMAPDDLNADGLLDPISAADYIQPRGAVQILLSMQEHRYHVLDAAEGDEVSSLQAWSGIGMVMTCGRHDGYVTVISGHSRRIDLTRFNIHDGTVIWRQPLFNDSAPRAQSAGTETIFLGTSCWDTADGRTMFGFNMGVYGPKAGLVNVPIAGFMDDAGALSWVLPELNGKPPLVPSLKIDFLLYAPAKKASLGEDYFIAFSPLIPGGATGLGIAMAINRARRKKGVPR